MARLADRWQPANGHKKEESEFELMGHA
jgi:hypothetical protein